MKALRLLSYNIRYGGAGREAQLAAAIREADPDLVVLQEATQPRVVESLAAGTGLETWAAHPGNSLAYLSRVPVAGHEWHRPRGSRRHFIEIVVGAAGLRVYGVHLSAVHSFWTERRRMRELRAMLAWVGTRGGALHVFAGDFNTLAPGELLDSARLPPRLRPLVWLSGGRVQYQTIPIMLAAGYVDAFRQLHPEEPGHTFPTWDPHVRLDFFFVPRGAEGRLRGCRVMPLTRTVREASDHLPLLAEFEAG